MLGLATMEFHNPGQELSSSSFLIYQENGRWVHHEEEPAPADAQLIRIEILSGESIPFGPLNVRGSKTLRFPLPKAEATKLLFPLADEGTNPRSVIFVNEKGYPLEAVMPLSIPGQLVRKPETSYVERPVYLAGQGIVAISLDNLDKLTVEKFLFFPTQQHIYRSQQGLFAGSPEDFRVATNQFSLHRNPVLVPFRPAVEALLKKASQTEATT